MTSSGARISPSLSIRRATRGDIPFLAWVVLEASRSHVGKGAWNLAIAGEDSTRLHYLETLLDLARPSWCHYSRFLVAEVDGMPAAALSGYAASDPDLDSTDIALRDAARAVGWSDAELVRSFERLSVFLVCLPEDVPDAWVVEWVAARPEHRRRGLVQALLDAVLEEGRSRGHATAQIGILIGNAPAQRAYEKVGFRAAEERRHPDFEAALGCPGLLGLYRPL